MPAAVSDTRTRILTAAAGIFLRDGFAGASVDAVAAAARMSKLSIYETFPSKVALFEAAVRNACNPDFVALRAEIGDAGIETSLERIGIFYFDRHIDPVNFGLFRANIVAANQFPDLAADLHMYRMRASQSVADHLRSWMDRGVLAEQDSGTAAIRFGGLCVEGSRYFFGAPAPAKAARRANVLRAVALFLHGYRAVEAGDPLPEVSVAPPELSGKVALRMSPDRLGKLIDAATEEFLANGYRGASIDQIVAAVQAARTTVYRQFGNKEGLFRFVVERAIHQADEERYEPPAGEDVDGDVTALALSALERHCEPADIRLQRMLIQEADIVPDLAQLYHQIKVARLGKALTAILEKHGLPAPDATMCRAFHVLATFSLRYLTVADLPDGAQKQRNAQEVARLFLHGAQSRSIG